jgi:hypothetical protein
METNRIPKLKILERFPDTKHLYPVYGVIVTLIYGWSLYQFLWLLPSWLKFLSPGEIGAIAAYALVSDLFESLLILACLLLIAGLLPENWMRGDFVLRGGLSALYILLLFVFVAYNQIPYQQIKEYWIWSVLGLGGLHLVAGKVRLIRKAIERLANGATLFLYLSLPLSALALLVVLIRNI